MVENKVKIKWLIFSVNNNQRSYFSVFNNKINNNKKQHQNQIYKKRTQENVILWEKKKKDNSEGLVTMEYMFWLKGLSAQHVLYLFIYISLSLFVIFCWICIFGWTHLAERRKGYNIFLLNFVRL